MTALRIGIMPQEKTREMTIAIAKGKYKPKRNAPKVWFPSMKAMSDKPNNVSRTLQTMKGYGLVELKPVKRRYQPIAKATEFLIEAS